jgi:hypothetical protein
MKTRKPTKSEIAAAKLVEVVSGALRRNIRTIHRGTFAGQQEVLFRSPTINEIQAAIDEVNASIPSVEPKQRRFKPTHELLYNGGELSVIPVMLQNTSWVAKDGTWWPANEDSYVRPLNRKTPRLRKSR